MTPGASPGWTGGQYSAVRSLLGLVLLGSALNAVRTGLAASTPLGVAAGLTAIPFAVLVLLGWHDRLAALVLMIPFWAGLVAGDRGGPLAWGPSPALLLGQAAPLAALGIHLALPPAPFGSVAARGRPDPDGAWRMPGWVPWVARALAGAALIYAATAAASGAAPVPWSSLPAAVPLLALAADPGWVRPAAGGTAVLFYDGTCGLCHRAVRFVLAEDRQGSIRFAPLGSPTFLRLVPESVRPGLPDSLAVWSPGGEVRVRSEAVLYLASRLGGWWRGLAGLGRLVPRPARDALYDGIARIRKRLFPTPAGVCPVVAPHLRSRFLEWPGPPPPPSPRVSSTPGTTPSV